MDWPRAAPVAEGHAPADEARLERLRARLEERYTDLTLSLDYSNALELLVATILSAQCTDARVNEVTPALFARFPTAEAYAGADREELEEYVRPTGFYRNKAKHIQETDRGDEPREGRTRPHAAASQEGVEAFRVAPHPPRTLHVSRPQAPLRGVSACGPLSERPFVRLTFAGA
jgi:hypothetical protein